MYIYIYIYIYIYVMKTVCSPSYHHNSSMSTNALMPLMHFVWSYTYLLPMKQGAKSAQQAEQGA